MPATRIHGASVWQQEVYDHLVTHIDDERDVLLAYERAAASTSSPAFAFLAGMILDDERRHHALLRDLAETVKTSAELSGSPTPIPYLRPMSDQTEIAELTERLLAIERADQRELKRLAALLRDVKDTSLWEFVVRLIERDNAKHREILEFIRTHLAK
jgi:hypothetical protein